jgi:hypothetical protein
MVEKKATKTVKKEKVVETPKKKTTTVTRKPKSLVLEVAKEEDYEKKVRECEC